jgi:hypothetical protein
VRGDQLVAGERSTPLALVARHQDDRARLVGERVVAPARRAVAPLAMACSWIRKDVTGSAGCDQDRRSTASRARSIAKMRLATSELLESSRTKFGDMRNNRAFNPSSTALV